MNDFKEKLKTCLSDIKTKSPVVHSITNFVTMQDCANITVAIGASPVMAYFYEEVSQITQVSQSVVLNTGTPDENRIKAIIASGKTANEKNIPVILDPVGVGASDFRKESIKKILDNVKPSVIKGNVAEIKTLAGLSIKKNKCVDSAEFLEEYDKEAFKKLALELKTVIAVTGKHDFITDGNRCCEIKRGSKMMTGISGSGCMTSSIIGSFCAVEKDCFLGALYGIFTMNVCAEKAEKMLCKNEGAGMFKVRLFDCIYNFYNDNDFSEEGVIFDL